MPEWQLSLLPKVSRSFALATKILGENPTGGGLHARCGGGVANLPSSRPAEPGPMEENPLARGWPGQWASRVRPPSLSRPSWPRPAPASCACGPGVFDQRAVGRCARRLPAVIPSALGLIPACQRALSAGIPGQRHTWNPPLSDYLARFADVICAANESTIRSDVTLGDQLVVERSGNLTISYAPFEHISATLELSS